MQHKSLRGRAFVKDAAQGIAELVVSAYGNVDHDGDIVEQGAVAKQIAGEYGPNPKGLLDHDWSMRAAVAKTLKMWEEPDGLHVEAQYHLAKQVGREAFDDLTFYGEDMEFSVGYEIKASRRPTDEERARGAKQVITEWRIDEWSHVMLGANSDTRLVTVKARARTDDGRKALTGAKSVVGSYEYLSDRLCEALEEIHAAEWLYVKATFADRVVFAMERRDDMGEWHYAVYEVSYTADGDVYVFGEPAEVRTAEVVEPKAAAPADVKAASIPDAQRREFELLLVTA